MNLIVFALKLDAVVTGVNGAAYLIAAPVLDEAFGVPDELLLALGVFLLAFAAVVWHVAGDPRPVAVTGVVAANVAWVAASVALVALDWQSPSTAGVVWTLMQAATVTAFAALQSYALSRASLSSPRSR